MLHKLQFSCLLRMNGNIPGMCCCVPLCCLCISWLCHAHSRTDAPHECWDERPQDFRDKHASEWAEDMD